MGGHPLRLEMVLTKRTLSGGAALVLVGALASFWYAQPDDAPIKKLAAWQQLASPGDLSVAHSRLEGDCGACHTAVKGASRTKCIACHATEERLLIWPELTFHASVRDCRACHPEHLGPSAPATRMDHVALATMGLDLLTSGESEVGRSVAQHLSSWIAESPAGREGRRAGHLAPAEAVLRCATCHAQSDAHREMFGSDCGECHGTSGWVISEYRHPSSASTDCAQCHRAPPCHQTPHFGRVCMPVAGKPNAEVRDCHSCHRAIAWNHIKGAGWYQSH
jgi:hypothetical protein